jgi:signal transduction histidine kinase
MSLGEPVPEADDLVKRCSKVKWECLRNVAKHSHTSAVAVRIELANAAVRLTVKDEGVGFRPGATGPCKGIGIGTTQDRVR